MLISHAPRERVSWNWYWNEFILWRGKVTLHVSVWVEIWNVFLQMISKKVTLHVSVWVEIGSLTLDLHEEVVTLHVSVWVEIVNPMTARLPTGVTLHVSVWVEMGNEPSTVEEFEGHAPRERVSWNRLGFSYRIWYSRHAPRERVSWNG